MVKGLLYFTMAGMLILLVIQHLCIQDQVKMNMERQDTISALRNQINEEEMLRARCEQDKARYRIGVVRLN